MAISSSSFMTYQRTIRLLHPILSCQEVGNKSHPRISVWNDQTWKTCHSWKDCPISKAFPLEVNSRWTNLFLPVVLGPSSQRAINTHLIIAADVQKGPKESRSKLTMGRGLGLAFRSLMFGNNANASPISRMASLIDVPKDMGLSLISFLGDLDPRTAQLAITFVGPLIALFNLLLVFRIVMLWYPRIPVKKFPFFLAYNPTEPILGPTRKLIPPVGGVDVSPVIWVALMSFTNEILLGKQGLLVLLSQQQS